MDVDGDSVGDSSEVVQQIGAVEDYLADLDQADVSTLDAVAESGVDMSTLLDEDGQSVDVPGGQLLTIAATAELPLSTVIGVARDSYTAALEANPDEANA
ncbi:hypothetical protein [Actinocrispum wychmicini]|uniref:hypothetical protein n=1 Tax=Actinocrispum wychmicini TaxID=1213861 RepID=UPI00104DAC85|nr:hypothetical protein [Actinocrispum wychmicini]